jgi:hypothetical protein
VEALEFSLQIIGPETGVWGIRTICIQYVKNVEHECSGKDTQISVTLRRRRILSKYKVLHRRRYTLKCARTSKKQMRKRLDYVFLKFILGFSRTSD